MRKILFRGKSTFATHKWLYGSYLVLGDKHYILPIDDKVLCNYEVIPETVGQFTGFTDINGVKIFDGDKLGGGIVVYDEHYCAFMIDFPHRSKKMYFENIVRMKVTGSIHDNP